MVHKKASMRPFYVPYLSDYSLLLVTTVIYFVVCILSFKKVY